MNISSVSSTTQNNSSDVSSAVSQSLSQEDFLKLLVTQMTSQDPLNPTNSQDLLSQMTEFSTLNANTALQTQMANMQSLNEFSEAGSLIGKQVTLQLNDTTTGSGIVSSVDTSGDSPQLIVDGKPYSLEQVISVANPSTAQ